MSQVVSAPQSGLGATARRDSWWIGPAVTALGLLTFIVYSTWAAFTGKHFEIRADAAAFSGRAVAPYLSPFYAPLIFDESSHHAWIQSSNPPWWPMSPAFLILWAPAGFRFTCYYYRKAYYRAFWWDPPGCAVGEMRQHYWGERSFPLILQNSHRYFMYVAVLFLALLWWDALKAFWWHSDRAGNPVEGQFGMGLGTIVMLVNCGLLTGYTLGCHSFRHLVGGRSNCFSCIQGDRSTLSAGYKAWRLSTLLNERHMLWAWCSLFSVGFTDFYIRMCSMNVFSDMRII